MSLERQTLQMSGVDGQSRYQVEPLVIMSILDHYKRRPLNQERVIGTLLGSRLNDLTVTINNCFPVPHNERSDDHVVAVDMDYQAQMAELFGRVSPNLFVVGWYTTGGASALSPSSVAIAKSFQSLMAPTSFEPVMLSVDTTLESSKLAIKAFRMTAVQGTTDPGATIVAVFDELDLNLITTEEDKIGIDALIQSQPDDDTFDSPATLLSPRRGLLMSLENLHGMLSYVAEYVDRVVAGEIPGDDEIGQILARTMAELPRFDAGYFDRAFNDAVSDLLAINFLTSLTRAQLAIADRVNLLA